MWAGHLNTMNLVFVDGHVASFKPLKTVQGLNRWGASQLGNVAGDGPGCGNGGNASAQWQADNAPPINCDVVKPELSAALKALEDKFS
jgi:prepilin-type processing-associated H-X9-DG protein